MIPCPSCSTPNINLARYCIDCGQRLNPASQDSTRLHSPLLSGPAVPPPAATEQPPLGRFADPRPHKARELLNHPQAPHAEKQQTTGRLHSPLLQGQEDAPQFRPEHHNISNVEGSVHQVDVQEDRNTLRSPLLAAKVPLPDTPAPSTMSPGAPVLDKPAPNPAPPKAATVSPSQFGNVPSKFSSASEIRTIVPQDQEALTPSSGLFKLAVIPLSVFALSKIWLICQYLGQPVAALDELGTLATVGVVIALCLKIDSFQR